MKFDMFYEVQCAKPWAPNHEQRLFDETIEQPYQRNRLQFEHVGEIDLRQPLLLPEPKQHDPLRAGCAAFFGAVVDVVAQQPRTLDKLRNHTSFQVERHGSNGFSVRFPGFSLC